MRCSNADVDELELLCMGRLCLGLMEVLMAVCRVRCSLLKTAFHLQGVLCDQDSCADSTGNWCCGLVPW